jgi:DNA helicase IV
VQDEAFEEERRFVEQAYERLGALRASVERALEEALIQERGGTHQARLERDVFVENALRRLETLDLGEHALVFGRLDREDGERYHIGRVSLSDEHGEPMVVDWRAPVAEPFYRATTKDPMGVERRWHLSLEHGRLRRLEVERLGGAGSDEEAIGPTALYAALERPRGPQMVDIVATIQADQDHLIRQPLGQALLIEGSPGTGKTAVALHRAAYLLYTYRWRLEHQGLLVVGPTPGFVLYVRDVLPSLGESGVELRSLASLRPGTKVGDMRSSPASRALRGDLRMVQLLRRAVRDRERPLRRAYEIPFGSRVLVVTPELSQQAVRAARALRGGHNQRRRAVEETLLRVLAQDVVHGGPLVRRAWGDDANVVALFGPGNDWPPRFPDDSEEDLVAEVRHELRHLEAFQRLLARLWPRLSAEEVLLDVRSRPALLRSAARGLLTAEEQRELVLAPSEIDPNAWTWEVEDVPLLDELDALLGTHEGRVFGHVVVDEAQDVSPMAARAIRRRLSGSSITLVGDRAQALNPRGMQPWSVLTTQLRLREPTYERLRVNYRSPARVGRLVAALRRRILGEDDADEVVVRRTPGGVELLDSLGEDVLARALERARALTTSFASVALVLDDALVANTAGGIDSILSTGPDLGTIRVSDVPGVRGMEFDAVVVADVAALVGTSEGLRGLYVAATRATQHVALCASATTPSWLYQALDEV